jgi:RNA ligase.
MHTLLKYPRTRHIEGSGLQKGDADLEQVPFSDLRGRHLVVEEKLDGANVGLWFTPEGEAVAQSRGHVLTGGPNEAQFGLLKTWLSVHQSWLGDVLSDRYILYGEWLYAKHTVFYDALPHYLMEFDIFDRHTETFLSTERRRAMLAEHPVVSVPVLQTGTFARQKDLTALVRPSLYKSPAWRESLRAAATAVGSDPQFVLRRETDDTDLSEGLYIKWEDEGQVLGRYKWVRRDFINAIIDSGSHWKVRPLIQNRLCRDVDLYGFI